MPIRGVHGTALTLAALIAAPGALAAVGRTPGTFAVDAGGAATYTIPINVAPGINGLQPAIALVYNSQAGDGPLGMRWSLAGFSSITRCNKTVATNGAAQGVAGSSTDQFCLDGQPLVRDAANTAAYGANGAVYRTEIDRYVRVTSYGDTNGGPTYFQVQQPNGLTAFYGNTTDSRIASLGTWKLNQIEDKYFNSVRFTYKGSAEDFNPAEVRWTEHCGILACASGSGDRYKLIFQYQARAAADQRRGYFMGFAWSRNTRLQTITYQLDAATVQEYTLGYTTPTSTGTQRSQLASVTQCGATSADCLPATSFQWLDGVRGWNGGWDGGGGATLPPGTVTSGLVYGDFDGDGGTDIAQVDGNLGSWTIFHFNGTSVVKSSTSIDALSNVQVGDFNGDGLDDLLGLDGASPAQWKIQLSNGSLAGPAFTTVNTNISSSTINALTVTDYNADGLPDLVYARNNQVYMRKNTGAAFPTEIAAEGLPLDWVPAGYSGDLVPDGSLIPADFNGDGRGDLLLHLHSTSSDVWYAYAYAGAPNEGTWEWIGQTLGDDRADDARLMDINGDGLSDIAYYATAGSSPGWHTMLSTGTTLTASQPVVDSLMNSDSRYAAVLDYNGDGRDDLLFARSQVRLSTGNALAATNAISGALFPYDYGVVIASPDINGDGAADLLYNSQTDLNDTNRHWYLLRRGQAPGAAAPVGDLVTAITDGLQNSISQITYRPLTDDGTGGVYTATGVDYLPSPALPSGSHHLVRGSSLPVVKQYSTNDGVGGTYTVNYHYTNNWLNTEGRGLLGFRRVEQTGGPSGALQTSTVYRQDFPYTGRAVEQAVCQQPGACSLVTGTKATSVATQWTESTPLSHFGTDPPYRQVRELSTQSVEYDAGGAVLRSTQHNLTGATDWNYALGAPNKEVTTVQQGVGGSSWTTTRDYIYGNSAVATAWCLGLPTRVDETRQNPGGLPATRTVTFEYLTTCKLFAQIVGPPNTVKTLRSEFVYNAYGNPSVHSGMDAVEQSAIRRTNYLYNAGQYHPSGETRIVTPSTTTFVPNACGGTTAITTPGTDLPTTFTWDYRLGLIQSETTPQGVVTSRTYDAFGRPATGDSRGIHTAYSYAACNNNCFPTNSAYKVTATRTEGTSAPYDSSTTFFDNYGRPVSETGRLIDGTESRQATRFNALGQVSQRDVPYIGTTTGYVQYDYDAIGRLLKETRPTGQNISSPGPTETTYTYAGLTTTVTDPEGRTRVLESNADGTLKEVREGPAGSPSSYEYWPFGELKTITDAGNQAGTRAVSSFGYDARGNLTSRSDGDRGSWTFDYNAWGELTVQIQPNGRQDFTYDVVGRPLTRTDKTADATLELTTGWSYYVNTDGAQSGLVKEVNTGNYHRDVFTYYTGGAGQGLVQQVRTTFPQTTQPAYDTDYSYNTAGRLQTVTYPQTPTGRFQVRYSYLNGYLQQVCQDSGGSCFNDIYTVGDATGAQQLPMDALGRVTRAYFGTSSGGTRETYSFDPANLRLSAIQTTGTAPQDYTYQWDRSGNLTRRTQPGQTEYFAYDPLNRLDVVSLGVAGTNVTSTLLDMAYDPNGNITSKVFAGSGGGTGTYSYGTNGSNRPHAVSKIEGNNGGLFHYDGAGNLDCRSWNTSANECNEYSTNLWYTFNLPKRLQVNETTYADFTYGPNRERVRTTEHEGGTERVIYRVGPHFEVEITSVQGSPTTTTHYRSTVFFGERAVYARVDGPDAFLQEGYLHQDHQGSLDRVTPITGITAQAFSFDAFGKRRDPALWLNDNTNTQFAVNQWLERGYTGHQHLDGVRLIHMNGRVQNPVWGRMLSPDPVVGDLTRPQSLNAYSYVMNNPLSFTDPTGYAVVVTCNADCKPPPPCGGSHQCTNVIVDGWSALVKTDKYVDGDGNVTYDSYVVAIVHRTADVADFGFRMAVFDYKDPLGGSYWLEAATLIPGGKLVKVVDAVKGLTHWGNPKTLLDHFARHGKDVGAASADDYAQKASDFFRRSLADGLPTKIDADGVIRVFDPKTNTFGAFNPDGTTRTFFQPVSPTYFDRQPGSAPWGP